MQVQRFALDANENSHPSVVRIVIWVFNSMLHYHWLIKQWSLSFTTILTIQQKLSEKWGVLWTGIYWHGHMEGHVPSTEGWSMDRDILTWTYGGTCSINRGVVYGQGFVDMDIWRDMFHQQRGGLWTGICWHVHVEGHVSSTEGWSFIRGPTVFCIAVKPRFLRQPWKSRHGLNSFTATLAWEITYSLLPHPYQQAVHVLHSMTQHIMPAVAHTEVKTWNQVMKYHGLFSAQKSSSRWLTLHIPPVQSESNLAVSLAFSGSRAWPWTKCLTTVESRGEPSDRLQLKMAVKELKEGCAVVRGSSTWHSERKVSKKKKVVLGVISRQVGLSSGLPLYLAHRYLLRTLIYQL